MAKIFQVNGAAPSENNEVVYVGIKSVAAKRLFAWSETIGVEKISTTQLDDSHKKNYNFIFIVNVEDLKRFLKVAKNERGALSYKKMNSSEKLAEYLEELRNKDFEIELVPTDFFDVEEEAASLSTVSIGQIESVEANDKEGKEVRLEEPISTPPAVEIEDQENHAEEIETYQTAIAFLMFLENQFIGRIEHTNLSQLILPLKTAWEKLNKSRDSKDLVALKKLYSESNAAIENYTGIYGKQIDLLRKDLKDLNEELVEFNDTLHPSVQGLFDKAELELSILKVGLEIDKIPLMKVDTQIQDVRQVMKAKYENVKVWEQHQVEAAKIIKLKQGITQGNILSNLALQFGKAEEKNAHFFKGAKEFFTNLFFSKITKEKQEIFKNILDNKTLVQELQTSLITSISEEKRLNAIKLKLANIKDTLQSDVKILQQARGFTFFGRKVVTTSDKIAGEVYQAANALEGKVEELIAQVSIVSGR